MYGSWHAEHPRPWPLAATAALLVLTACGEAPEDSLADGRQVDNKGREGVMPIDSPKFSPECLRLMSELAPGQNPEVNIMLQLDGELTDGRRAQLEAAGARIETVAGDVVSVRAPARSMSGFAELEFTVYVQVSRPMHMESETE